MSVSPDGRRVAAFWESSIAIYDAVGNELFRWPIPKGVQLFAWSADGLLCTFERTTELRDPSTGARVRTVLESDWPRAMDRPGRLLAVTELAGVRVVDLHGEVRARLANNPFEGALTFRSDSTALLGSTSTSVSVWELSETKTRDVHFEDDEVPITDTFWGRGGATIGALRARREEQPDTWLPNPDELLVLDATTLKPLSRQGFKADSNGRHAMMEDAYLVDDAHVAAPLGDDAGARRLEPFHPATERFIDLNMSPPARVQIGDGLPPRVDPRELPRTLRFSRDGRSLLGETFGGAVGMRWGLSPCGAFDGGIHEPHGFEIASRSGADGTDVVSLASGRVLFSTHGKLALRSAVGRVCGVWDDASDAGTNRTLALHECATGRLLSSLPLPRATKETALGGNDELVLIGNEVHATRDGRLLYEAEPAGSARVTYRFTSDGRYVYADPRDDGARVSFQESATGHVVAQLAGVGRVEWSPDGTTALVWRIEQRALVFASFDTTTGQLHDGVPEALPGPFFAPRVWRGAHGYAALFSRNSAALGVYDLAKGSVVQRLELPPRTNVMEAAIAPSGDALALTDAAGSTRVTRWGKTAVPWVVVRTRPVGRDASGPQYVDGQRLAPTLLWSDDGDRLAVLVRASRGSSMELFDAGGTKSTGAPHALESSTEDDALVTAEAGDRKTVWSLKTLAPLGSFVTRAALGPVALTANGKVLAHLPDMSTMELVNLVDGRTLTLASTTTGYVASRADGAFCAETRALGSVRWVRGAGPLDGPVVDGDSALPPYWTPSLVEDFFSRAVTAPSPPP